MLTQKYILSNFFSQAVSLPISVTISLEVRQSGEEVIRRRAGMVPRRGERAEE